MSGRLRSPPESCDLAICPFRKTASSAARSAGFQFDAKNTPKNKKGQRPFVFTKAIIVSTVEGMFEPVLSLPKRKKRSLSKHADEEPAPFPIPISRYFKRLLKKTFTFYLCGEIDHYYEDDFDISTVF